MSKETQKTIVVVDNNPANLELLSDLLASHDYKIIKAHDGKEGYFAAQQHSPDLMIIDKELPKMTSYELAERMKDDKNLKQVPLLSVIDSHYKFCDLDFYEDCLQKPLSSQHLLETIEGVIKDNPIDFSGIEKEEQKVC